MLLFCAWLGAAHGSILSAERIGFFEGLVRSWHEDVVKPLRGVRDTVKSRADFADNEMGALRARVLAVELDAERIEQALLYRAALQSMPGALADAVAATRANVLTYLQSKTRAAHRGDPALPAALLAAAAKAVA